MGVGGGDLGEGIEEGIDCDVIGIADEGEFREGGEVVFGVEALEGFVPFEGVEGIGAGFEVFGDAGQHFSVVFATGVEVFDGGVHEFLEAVLVVFPGFVGEPQGDEGHEDEPGEGDTEGGQVGGKAGLDGFWAIHGAGGRVQGLRIPALVWVMDV